MTILFWALISLLLAVTLIGARRMRGVDVDHILYRWHDVMGVAMIGGVICMIVLKITIGL
jgi:hypothetical protein